MAPDEPSSGFSGAHFPDLASSEIGSAPVKVTFERAVMSERKIDIYNHVMHRIRELAPGKGDMVKRV
jgi:hypothetical protein